MKSHIAEALIAATNLVNTLQTINRERERISENATALQRFEACKQLRRKILRYIHHVESEQWLGSLLHANDELVTALMTFEQLDRSIDADSDSDDDLAQQAHLYRSTLFSPFRSPSTSPIQPSPVSITNPPAPYKSGNRKSQRQRTHLPLPLRLPLGQRHRHRHCLPADASTARPAAAALGRHQTVHDVVAPSAGAAVG